MVVKIGMDLITTMVVSKKDTELDWDAGMKAADSLTPEDVDLEWIDNFIYLDAGDEAEQMQEVKDRVKVAIDSVRGHIEGMSRMLNVWTMFGHNLFIFGESSWGDADEVFDDVGILDASKPVMEAIGFVTEFDEA